MGWELGTLARCRTTSLDVPRDTCWRGPFSHGRLWVRGRGPAGRRRDGRALERAGRGAGRVSWRLQCCQGRRCPSVCPSRDLPTAASAQTAWRTRGRPGDEGRQRGPSASGQKPEGRAGWSGAPARAWRCPWCQAEAAGRREGLRRGGRTHPVGAPGVQRRAAQPREAPTSGTPGVSQALLEGFIPWYPW